MYSLGIDIGASSVKLALLQGQDICFCWEGPCRCGIAEVLQTGLSALCLSSAGSSQRSEHRCA